MKGKTALPVADEVESKINPQMLFDNGAVFVLSVQGAQAPKFEMKVEGQKELLTQRLPPGNYFLIKVKEPVLPDDGLAGNSKPK